MKRRMDLEEGEGGGGGEREGGGKREGGRERGGGESGLAYTTQPRQSSVVALRILKMEDCLRSGV